MASSDDRRRPTETDPLCPSSVIGHPISCGPAVKTVGDRGGTFKPGTGTERRDGGPPAGDQGAAGGTGALDGHGFDARDQLIEGNRPAPGEHLASELLRAGAG